MTSGEPTDRSGGNPDVVAPAARQLSIGEMIAGRYKIISLIGQGAMGSVYAVEQVFLQKRFALKTLNPIAATDVVLRRFHNEAQTTSRLDHPNLVQSIDFGLIDNNQPFLVMDYVEGQTLSHFLRERGKLSVEMALQIFIPICFAIGYAHQEGVVHRDIKPGNILLAESDSIATDFIPKIVDFGISKLAGADEKQALTRTGEVFGTPLYMSPEQCAGSKIDKRSDIYSLGCVMFEALTGSAPFVGPTALETMMKHTHAQLPTMKEASLGTEFPGALENIIAKMLARDPKDRYQSCLEVAEDLMHFQSNPLMVSANQVVAPKPESLIKTLLVAVSVCTVFGAFGYTWYSHNHSASKEQKQQSKQESLPTDQNLNQGSLVENPDDVIPAKSEDYVPMADSFRDYSVREGMGFNFPPNESMGDMFYWTAAKTIVQQKALKTVVFPKDSKRILVAGVSLGGAPKYAQYFNEGDYSGLIIEYSMNPDDGDFDKGLEALTRFKSLQILGLSLSHISAESLLHINALPHLRWLNSKKSLTADEIANLRHLRELSVLGIADTKHVTAVLKKVAGSTALQRLSLVHAGLTAADVGLVAKCRCLTHLNLMGNFERVGEQLDKKEQLKCIAQLATLPNLRFLAPGNVLYGNKFEPDVLKELSKMKKLQVLYILFHRPEATLQQLRSCLSPTCRLIVSEKPQDPGWFDPRHTDPADLDPHW